MAGEAGRRWPNVAAGLAIALGVLGIFALADRFLAWERARIARSEARTQWDEISDILQGCVGEAARMLDLAAGVVDGYPSGQAEQALGRLAPGAFQHVHGLTAVALTDAQGGVTYAVPQEQLLHAGGGYRLRMARPLRDGRRLVAVVDTRDAWERIGDRLRGRNAGVRIDANGQTLYQSGKMNPKLAAAGTVPIGDERWSVAVCSGEHPMSRLRALLAGLALALSVTAGIGTVVMRRRRELANELDRDAAERASEVERERHRYRDFYLRVPVPCLSLALDGTIRDVNQAMLKVLGLSREETVGRPLPPFLNDESRARLPDILRQLQRDRGLQNVELDLLRADGSVATLRCDATVHVDLATGSFQEVRVVGLDVTEIESLRRRASEALALQTMGRFAGVISHEVRNPLGVATLVNDVLSHAVAGRVDLLRLCERQRDALRTVERILSDSLDFLRAPRPRQVSVDLPTLLREAVDASSGLASARGVGLELLADVDVEFLADPHKLRQVLVNLIENAIQACPAHGQGRVRVFGTRTREHIELHVEDNGSGIPADRRERVFEPFFTSKGHGTGLGLAVVKQVVEAHGGRVWFETEEGQGTHFHVRLPYKPAPLEATGQPHTRTTHPLRLLVVEDDPDSREILLGALREAGHQVAGAATADEALARIEQQPPDVVISDYQLGAASATGETVVRAAKQHEPPIPAVLVTGISAPASVAADATLYKPLAVSNLLRIIERLAPK